MRCTFCTTPAHTACRARHGGDKPDYVVALSASPLPAARTSRCVRGGSLRSPRAERLQAQCEPTRLTAASTVRPTAPVSLARARWTEGADHARPGRRNRTPRPSRCGGLRPASRRRGDRAAAPAGGGSGWQHRLRRHATQRGLRRWRGRHPQPAAPPRCRLPGAGPTPRPRRKPARRPARYALPGR